MPGAPAFDVRFNPTQFSALQRGLKNLAPEIRKELNKALRTVAGEIKTDAQSRAAWSSRIPGAIGVSVSTTRVGVKVNRKKAPHGAAYEGFSGGRTKGSFRHPVYGNRQNWVRQATRPYLAPAVQSKSESFYRQAGEAIDTAAGQVGWR